MRMVPWDPHDRPAALANTRSVSRYMPPDYVSLDRIRELSIENGEICRLKLTVAANGYPKSTKAQEKMQ